MAGDTFDAGTVVAESRLDRDQVQRDILALRRDLAKFERDSRVSIKPKFDPKEAKAGIRQIEQMLRDVARTTARPKVVLTGVAPARKQVTQLVGDLRRLSGLSRARVEVVGLAAARSGVAALLTMLRTLHGMVVRPEIDLNGSAAALAQVGALMAALQALAAMNASPNINLGGGILGQISGMNGGLGSVLRMLALVPAAAAVAGAGVWALSAAIGSIAAASQAVAVLPALLGGLIGIVATVKLGMQGVGDALKAAASGDAKALAEAMKELAPAAREYVLEIQKLRPAYEQLQLGVQQQLFQGLGKAVGELGRNYLPIFGRQLTMIAGELRQTALQTIAVANGAWEMASVEQVLNNTWIALDFLNPTFGHLLQILLDLAAVGSSLLPGMAEGFRGWAAGAQETVRAMRDSGELLIMMENGLAVVGQLWDLLKNVGSILVSVFGTAASTGGNVLSLLVDMTGQLAAFLNSAEGTQLLVTFFTAMRDTAVALQPGLAAIGDTIGYLINTVAPVLPDIGRGISTIVIALAPILKMLGDLVATVAPPLVAFIDWLGPAIGPVTAALLGMFAAFKIISGVVAIINIVKLAWIGLNAAFLISPVGLIISLIVIAIAGLVAGFMYLWNTSEGFRGFWIGLWEALKTAALATWDFLVGVFDWLAAAPGVVAAAFTSAWAWVVSSTEAVGSAIAGAWQTAMDAIGSAATWLYENAIRPAWDGIVAGATAVGNAATWLWQNAIKPAFDFISLAARTLLAVLVTIVLAPIILAVKAVGAIFSWLWENAIRPAWEAISGFISDTWTGTIQPVLQAVADFITTTVGVAWTWLADTISAAWTTITDAVSVAWEWLVATVFQPMIDFIVGQLQASWEGWKIIAVAVWTTIQEAIAIAWAFIRDQIWQPIVDFINGPLLTGWNFLRDSAVAAWQVIQDALSAAWQWILANVWQPIIDFINGPLATAWEATRLAAVTAWEAISGALSTVWEWIKTNIFDPIVHFVTVTIPEAFNRAVEGIKGAWDKIQGIVGPPIKFMVDLVYNEGIVPAWNWIAGLVNLPKLEKVSLGFHSGGVVPGPAGTYSDNRLARVNGGEAVMRPEWTRAMGPKYVEDMNRLAMNGGPNAVLKAMNSGAIVEGADHNGPGTSTVGFGGVRPHVAQAGHYLKSKFGIGSVGGVGARANASDHPKGLALDFMTSGENGTALADFVRGGTNKQHFGVTYVIWRQRIDSGSGWRGMANRGSPTANHMDHVHVSFGGPGGGPMDGGVGFITELTAMWNKVLDFMKRINEFTATEWGKGGMGLLQKLVDGAWGFLSGRAMGGGPATNTGPAGAAGPGAGNFFDNGGYLPVGTSVVTNATGKPEPVLTPEQWRAITAPPPPPTQQQQQEAASAAQFDRLSAVMSEVRDLLERRGTGATVNVNQQGDPTATARAAVLQLRL